MASIRILDETFTPDGVNVHGDPVGTVQIDLGFRRVVTTRASRYTIAGTPRISVAGFIGRYRTVNTPWLASVSGSGDRLFVNFGRDDRSGRFNKQNAISFEPELYASMSTGKMTTAVAA